MTRFILKAAIVGQSVDLLLKTVLAEDRMALDPDLYTTALQRQLLYINLTPILLFKRMARLVAGLGARQFENECLHGSYLAASYVDRRVFLLLRDPVNQICKGDLNANMQLLANPETPEPKSQTLAKAQRLLRKGHPPYAVGEA